MTTQTIKHQKHTREGVTRTLLMWAAWCGISWGAMRQRITKWGIGDDRTFTRKAHARRMKGAAKTLKNKLISHPITGERLTGEQWAKRNSLKWNGQAVRFRNWGVDDPRSFQSKEEAIKKQREQAQLSSSEKHANWGNLTNKDRSKNLDNIPSPTRHEKDML